MGGNCKVTSGPQMMVPSLLQSAKIINFFSYFTLFKNLDEIAITTSVYLYKHCQKTETLCRHVLRFPTFTTWTKRGQWFLQKKNKYAY